MKLSISNIAWPKEQDENVLTYLAGKGFTGLEIAPTRLIPDKPYDNLNHAKLITDKVSELYYLHICSMQSILYGQSERLFGTLHERNALISHTRKAIDFASAIGCRNLVFGSPKNRIIDNSNNYKVAVCFFAELGEYALEKQTILSIEPNPVIYNTNFINTTEQAFQLVNDVGVPGFMVNVDLGTIIYNNEALELIAKDINLVNHIHISEPYLEPIKRRQLHVDLFMALKESLYDKYVSIEMKDTGNLSDVKEVIGYIAEVSKS